MLDETPVAIIMRSKDEYPHVERALRALERQTYKNYVLYNIDSGSTDGTWESILRHNTASDRIVRIRPEDYIPGRVLNLMVAMAREPIVVFLNADAVPINTRWLENLLRPILEDQADATMSRQIPRDDAYFIVGYDYERAYDRRNIEGKNDDFFSAVSCAFRREIWSDTKFYIEGYSEDLVWAHASRKKGYRFRLIEGSLVEHSHNYTLKQLYKRHLIEGEAEIYVYGRSPSPIRQALRLGKELARDLIYSIRRGYLWTVPYNVVYRIVAHAGHFAGEKRGVRRHGFSPAPSSISEAGAVNSKNTPIGNVVEASNK